MKKYLLFVLFIFFAKTAYCVEPAVIDNLQSVKILGYSALTVTSKGSVGSASNPLNVTFPAGVLGSVTVQNPVTVTWTAGLVGLDVTNNALQVGVLGMPSYMIDLDGRVKTITKWHDKEHTGDVFSHGNTLSAMSTSVAKYFCVFVPNGVTIHVRLNVTSVDGAIYMQSFTGTFDGGGTTLTGYATNKTVSKVSNVKVYEDGITLTATPMYPPKIIGTASTGAVGSKSGSSLIQSDEDYYILGAGSYFIRLLAANANVIGDFTFNYYLQ